MIKFRTPVTEGAFPFKIGHRSKVLCLGSCFAEHIGNQLKDLKFPSQINPFGILYNPASIARALALLIENQPFEKTDLHERDGLWCSFDHHSRFSNTDAKSALMQINRCLELGHQQLKQVEVLSLTFGTSFTFVSEASGNVVANCHKWPARFFERQRLDVEKIGTILIPIFQRIKSENPNVNILLTVSPVRHLKDGLIDNQRSKAILLLACEQLTERFDFVHYFPAYELLIDDLRDYRFYKEDLIHPNDLAIRYIWHFFANHFFTAETQQLNTRIAKIKQAVGHRAFQVTSHKHQQFLKTQLERIRQLQQAVPGLDFTEEIQMLQSQLIYE